MRNATRSLADGESGDQAATPYIHGADKIPALVAVASDMPGPFVVAFVPAGQGKRLTTVPP